MAQYVRFIPTGASTAADNLRIPTSAAMTVYVTCAGSLVA